MLGSFYLNSMASNQQDVNSLKGNLLCSTHIETFNQSKASVDKAEYLTKSYFGKDKQKQIAQLLDEPLKKLNQIPIDSSTVDL